MAAQLRSSAVVASAASVTPVRCGELHCQTDSYARTLNTVVVSCEPKEAVAPAPAAGKGKKKGNAAPPPVAEQLWDVVLGDSVIFPEGGGQPSDSGTVGGISCLRVDNVDGLATHVLTAPLEPGTPVVVNVDWHRREDHMAQHSTQHLVTAIALQKWGVETTSWGLGEQTSFLELGTPEVTPAMLSELEDLANEAVKAATPVTPSWHSVADVNEGAVPGLRKSSKPLPPSVTGPVRVISYEGIDTNTCCGTHVKDTAHLQAIKLLRVEKAKGVRLFAPRRAPHLPLLTAREATCHALLTTPTFPWCQACRVHYVAGGRVIRYLGGAYERASALASRMNVPQEDLLERYEEASSLPLATWHAQEGRLPWTCGAPSSPSRHWRHVARGRYEENAKKGQEHEKAAKALALEVVALLGEALKARVAAGEKVVHVHRAAADADFVKALATTLDEALGAHGALLLVTVGEGAGEGTFTLAGPPALVDTASAGVAKALEGRGGGKSGRFQGKCQKLGAAGDALAAATSALA